MIPACDFLLCRYDASGRCRGRRLALEGIREGEAWRSEQLGILFIVPSYLTEEHALLGQAEWLKGIMRLVESLRHAISISILGNQ